MVAMVALVFPDVNYDPVASSVSLTKSSFRLGNKGLKRTESITVSNLCPPAPYEVDLVFRHLRHLRIPAPDQIHVLVDFVGFDLVEDDGVYVFAPGQHLRKRFFNLLIQLLSLLRAVDEGRKRAFSLRGFLGR